MTFLQNNNNLPTFHQHQSNTTTTEKKKGQNPVEVDNDDVLSTSRELQETVSNRVKTILNEDEQHKTRKHSNKENITSNSDTSSFSSLSSTNTSQHSSSRNKNSKNNNNQQKNEPLRESSLKRTFSTKPSTSKSQENNIYINNNLTYGDALQTSTGSLTRILGHNVNGIESSNFATLELVCDSMRKFHIDVDGLSETNLHFNNPQV